ncbi:MAG: methionine--tRNA ligase, partial [Patescibacteria group bacterium]
IDYANAAPHMGHVMEKIMADVVARRFRLRGNAVRFQIGMDEHGVKIQQTAEKQGISPADLVEKMHPLYRELYRTLDISFDAFVRTTDRERHWPTVAALWEKLREAGALEKRSYTGLYCPGCERFLTRKELVEGKCPLHNVAPQEVEEENTFFLLGRKGKDLKELLTAKEGGYRIVPVFRAPETLSLIEQGLEDVSFSRPQASLSWGIPVPGDPGQVMYVWCDALANYISGIGLLTDHEEPEWWNEATVTHVIGKDIARFHALIWPAMLRYAGIRTPDRLLIHGFLTSEGQKMSKTIGNVVVPQDVIEKFGVDPLRFYLSHQIPVGNDGDFSWKRFQEIYEGVLGNQLGNLLNRVLVLLKKEGGVLSSAGEDPLDIDWKGYTEAFDAFELQKALSVATGIIDRANKFIDVRKPWGLKGEEKKDVLAQLAEGLRHITLMLLPFMPGTAQKMARQLELPYAEKMLEKEFVITEEMKVWGGERGWGKVGEPEILFPRLVG